MNKTKNYYESQAKHFAASRDNLHWDFLEQFADELKDKTILDVGCGQGRLLNHVTIDQQNYLGIDYSQSMIAEAKLRYPAYTFEVKDILQPLRLHSTFDAVTAIAVLQHMSTIDELHTVLQNLVAILKPSGLFIATIWDIEHEVLAEKIIEQDEGIIIPTKNKHESRWYLKLDRNQLQIIFEIYFNQVTITLEKNNFTIKGIKK